MAEWLSTNGTVWTYGSNYLVAPGRIPYIDIQCPAGFNPEQEGCGKAGGTWNQIDSAQNVWRFSYNDSNWETLFYGDFKSTDGVFRCVGSGNTDLVTQMNGLFRGCTGLVSCVTIDTSNCWHLGAMFSTCTNLTAVPYLNTSNCLDFNNFVVACPNLISVDTRIDTSKGKCFYDMFGECHSLQTIPTIDLRNADDTWKSSPGARGGNDGIFHGCPSLTYIHVIGGAGISDVSSMFVMRYNEFNKPYGVLTINWEDCYLPLVTSSGGMFETIMDYQTYPTRPAATYYSVSSISVPNIGSQYAYGCVPQAVHLGNINVPNVRATNYPYSFQFNNDLESIGTVNITPSTISGSAMYYSNFFNGMFEGCNKLTQFPNVVMPTPTNASNMHLDNMFKGVTNVGAGSYAFYQDLISKGYGSTYHSQTFNGCGSNTTAGAADLAQIPSDWK